MFQAQFVSWHNSDATASVFCSSYLNFSSNELNLMKFSKDRLSVEVRSFCVDPKQLRLKPAGEGELLLSMTLRLLLKFLVCSDELKSSLDSGLLFSLCQA